MIEQGIGVPTQGARILRALQKLTGGARLYADNNDVVVECAQELAASLAEFDPEAEGHVTIQIGQGRFFLNGEKMAYTQADAQIVRHLLDYFTKLGLHGIRFDTAVRALPCARIIAFARMLNQAEQVAQPLPWLLEQLQSDEFQWVELLQPAGDGGLLHGSDQPGGPVRAYSQALSSIRNVAHQLSLGRPASMRAAMRGVQEIVDMVMDDESILMGLSTLRDYDDYTFVHSVNVAILAIGLGKRIGLSRSALSELGICALLHDLGKVAIPPEIIKKSEKLTEEEFARIREHPVHSALQIMKLSASREIKSRVLLAPLEHHRKYDLSGYPRTRRAIPVSLFGRVLAIADVFDAVTSIRSYRPSPLSPDRAVQLMLRQTGKDFDPILLKVFIGMVGLYPVGTLVELDTGNIGLVAKVPLSPDEWRPRILILRPDGKGGYHRGQMVDLTERESASGAFRRNIVASHHPSQFGIQPTEFLL